MSIKATESPPVAERSLGRSERRFLRRLFNGRTVPVVVDGTAFLTYREASRYLLSLDEAARERAYGAMRRGGDGDTGS